MAICVLICWGILLRDLECKTERHDDFVALQNLSVVWPSCLLFDMSSTQWHRWP